MVPQDGPCLQRGASLTLMGRKVVGYLNAECHSHEQTVFPFPQASLEASKLWPLKICIPVASPENTGVKVSGGGGAAFLALLSPPSKAYCPQNSSTICSWCRQAFSSCLGPRLCLCPNSPHCPFLHSPSHPRCTQGSRRVRDKPRPPPRATLHSAFLLCPRQLFLLVMIKSKN